jgi:hypothetical protein
VLLRVVFVEKNQNYQGLYARHNSYRGAGRETFAIRARYVVRLILAPFLSESRGLRPFIGCGPPALPTKIEAGRYNAPLVPAPDY